MNHQDVVAQLIEIIQPLVKNRQVAIGEDTELTGQLAMDSLQVMDLVVAVEDHFDINVPLNSLAEVKTVGDLALQIQKVTG
jgi:acyl carrier protein